MSGCRQLCVCWFGSLGAFVVGCELVLTAYFLRTRIRFGASVVSRSQPTKHLRWVRPRLRCCRVLKRCVYVEWCVCVVFSNARHPFSTFHTSNSSILSPCGLERMLEGWSPSLAHLVTLGMMYKPAMRHTNATWYISGMHAKFATPSTTKHTFSTYSANTPHNRPSTPAPFPRRFMLKEYWMVLFQIRHVVLERQICVKCM